MDTERIAALLEVLESGSLSAAAEKLGYSPSGLSRQIATLEQETGLTLLRREHRGVSPTDACRRLLEPMRRMLSAEDAYRQQAAAIRGLDQGKIRIGCAYGSYLPYLAELVARFSSEHPGVHVEILEGTSSQMRDLVREGTMDFALISRREGELDWLPLRQDRLLAVVPPLHPLHNASAYPLNRFETDDFIEILPGTETDNSRFFARNGLKPKVRFSCTDPLSALSMVEAGLGITLVNEILLDNWNGQAVRLPLNPPEQVEIGIALPDSDEATPAARVFLALLKTE